MTPAIKFVKERKLAYKVLEYEHDSASDSYGLEAAEKLGVPEPQVFKTLVVSLDGQSLAVAIVPVIHMLSMKRVARAAGAKRAVMATRAEVERATGYVLGGVSPLGQKKPLPTFIDISAEQFDTIYVSAGRRGLEIELSPQDLRELVNGTFTILVQG